jgi:hypothetical protein
LLPQETAATLPYMTPPKYSNVCPLGCHAVPAPACHLCKTAPSEDLTKTSVLPVAGDMTAGIPNIVSMV